jgi:hypothetical protein
MRSMLYSYPMHSDQDLKPYQSRSLMRHVARQRNQQSEELHCHEHERIQSTTSCMGDSKVFNSFLYQPKDYKDKSLSVRGMPVMKRESKDPVYTQNSYSSSCKCVLGSSESSRVCASRLDKHECPVCYERPSFSSCHYHLSRTLSHIKNRILYLEKQLLRTGNQDLSPLGNNNIWPSSTQFLGIDKERLSTENSSNNPRAANPNKRLQSCSYKLNQNLKRKQSFPYTRSQSRDLYWVNEHNRSKSDRASNRWMSTNGFPEFVPLSQVRAQSKIKNGSKVELWDDPLACDRKPHPFLSNPSVKKGTRKYRKTLSHITKRPKNPGFTPNFHADLRPVTVDSKFKRIFHPRLGRKIDWQHPDYFKLSKRRRKISPGVGLQMQSCAVFARGPVGSWGGSKTKREPLKFELNRKPHELTNPNPDLVSELVNSAPESLNNDALEYLRTDWDSHIKHNFPDFLEAITSQDGLREKMVKLKYIVQV